MPLIAFQNMYKSILTKVQPRPELIVLLMMVLVIGMLIVPMPAYVLDFLIGVNIVTALLVFMGSFYIVNILEFSTFPSIVLITTMFRLALSISSSRLILLEAQGGKIIATFGQFVIGDNPVVGFVVFAIVTIVQFLVITKGVERVAEVAARFSLDAMPGKQMSVDADLKAGIIDNDSVKKRRSDLERESQLYGSFDGAMKFIKGDAIAGIIVIFVNLIGGLSVGVAQHGMSMSEALTTYTILTIGDGLVAQIPALLIAIAAGFVVTRVGGSGKNLGAGIVGELFSNSFALAVTAALSIGIGLLPGFPLPVFVLISAALLGLGLRKQLRGGSEGIATDGASAGLAGRAALVFSDGTNDRKGEAHNEFDIDKLIPETVPLIMMVSERTKPLLEKEQVSDTMRRRAFVDMGVRLPQIHISYSPELGETEVVIMINEIRAATFSIDFHRSRVIGSTLKVESLPLELMRLPDGTGGDALWVRQQDVSGLEKMDVKVRSALEELYGQFLTLVLRNVREFSVFRKLRVCSTMLVRNIQICKKKHIDISRRSAYRKYSKGSLVSAYQCVT